MSEVEEKLARHQKIVEALDSIGAVDFFYVFVDLNDNASSGFRIGNPDEVGLSNTGRFHRMIGAVEEAKVDVIDHMHEGEDELDEEDE